MYSKKNQTIRNNYEKNRTIINPSSKTNNLKKIQKEANKNIDNSLNIDYLKDYYYSKKKKKNFVSYYSKKKFKSIILDNEKIHLSNYIIHPEPFYSDLSNFNKNKKAISYTIKNPKKEKSKNKDNKIIEYNISKNTINNDTEEDLNNLNLNSNNSNTIFTDFLNSTESNKNLFINRSNRSYNIRRNIDLSRYKDKNFSSKNMKKNKDIFPQSSSNTSKRVSFIIDYSKDEDIDNIYYNFNTSNIRKAKSPICNSHYNESIFIKKKKNKTPNKNTQILIKQINYRRMKFEKIREIEKRIKNYFIDNGIELKNRELYHQSAIMIQSTFRAYLSRMKLIKELNKFVRTRLIFDLLNTFLSKKIINYYKNFFNNIKSFKKFNNMAFMGNESYQYQINNRIIFPKKSNILKNDKNKFLKIELASYLNIISKNKCTKYNKNQNLILLNKKLSKEKIYLEEELEILRKENEKLKKENEIYKLNENQFSNINILTNNKIAKTDIHKNDENIENVSLELKEIKIKKKKIDGLNVPILNLKKNINEKSWKDQNNYKININKYKYFLLKYLIMKKIMNQKEYQRKIFYRYIINTKKLINIEYEKKDELLKISRLKNGLNIINYNFRKFMYNIFVKIIFNFLYLKEINQKRLLYIPKAKIKAIKITNNENIGKIENNDNKEKCNKLKNIIQKKIYKQNNILQKIFIKFYYQSLLNNNSPNNNFVINMKNKNIQNCSNIKIQRINKLEKIVINKRKKNEELLKLSFSKFYYKGIIFSLKLNIQKANENKNIYIKKGFENKKINKIMKLI